MHPGSRRCRLIAAALAVPLAVAAPPATAQAPMVVPPGNAMVLSIGRGELVSLPGRMTDVFVANEEIADVQVKSANQLYVFGKSGGETTMYASDGAGRVIWSATVRVGANLDSIDQMLGLAMPEARVGVATMNGTVLLTGTVAAPQDAAEAERLVKAFVGDKTMVVSRLRLATPLQVNLQVRFAEVSRTLVREIGANLLTRDKSGGFLFGVARGRDIGTIGNINVGSLPLVDASSLYGLPAGSLRLPFDPASGNFVTRAGTQFTYTAPPEGQTAVQLAGRLFGLDVMSALDLGETAGLVTTLSQPNLTALSGETADFLAGGEFPVPVSQGLGTTSIEYRKFGVSLSYTPTVLANGRISMRVRPEVSELSTQGAVVLNGFQVPALTIRRAETTVELGSGQSFMIAGLLSNGAQNTVVKAPGAGDLPILGSLFRSTAFRRGETELVIIVTPYLVKPIDANDIKLPTDGYQSPNDIQRLFGNMENDGKSGAARPGPTLAPSAPAATTAPEAAPVPPPAPPEKRKRKDAPDAAARPGFDL
ncbi:MAG: type II and III secretion system protein family protein [Novosphingobium sp.]